jgi:NADPH2 dehydrogenase
MQLWALGRGAEPEVLKKDGHPYVSSSASLLPRQGIPDVTPKELSKAEIGKYVGLYAQAAKNAVVGAGFDGVEIHGAKCVFCLLLSKLRLTLAILKRVLDRSIYARYV